MPALRVCSGGVASGVELDGRAGEVTGARNNNSGVVEQLHAGPCEEGQATYGCIDDLHVLERVEGAKPANLSRSCCSAFKNFSTYKGRNETEGASVWEKTEQLGVLILRSLSSFEFYVYLCNTNPVRSGILLLLI